MQIGWHQDRLRLRLVLDRQLHGIGDIGLSSLLCWAWRWALIETSPAATATPRNDYPSSPPNRGAAAGNRGDWDNLMASRSAAPGAPTTTGPRDGAAAPPPRQLRSPNHCGPCRDGAPRTHATANFGYHLSWAILVRKSVVAVGGVEGLAEVVGEGAVSGDGLPSGLDLDGAVSAGCLDEFSDRPACRCLDPAADGEGCEDDGEVGSMESRVRW
jgi:hypothetical protein